MAILDAASVPDRKRLLELFPIAQLRASWPQITGTKEELCHEVAQAFAVDQIAKFVDETLNCCRQHIYVFTQPDQPRGLPDGIRDGERVRSDGNAALYLTRSVNRVVLRDPLEETTLEFLWPIRVEVTAQNFIVRFVVLEKNIGSYFERPYYVTNRGIGEEDVLNSLTGNPLLTATDLHKGVKALWENGFMDSHRTKYKKPISMASEAMDEERGIREHNPELYEVLKESPLYNTLFSIPEDKGLSVEVFSVDPSRGAIAFPRYSDTAGDTDSVVRQILENN